MTITADSISMRRRQVCVLDLIEKKNWWPYRISMEDTHGYRQRMIWLKETLGESFSEFEDLDMSFAYRWYSAPTTSAMGLIDGVVVAFREEEDRTMFVLRWA